MIVYFSGTGNSRWCAQLLAQQLKDEPVDAFSLIKSEAALTSQTPWVFVCPTYAWQLPHFFADFLHRCHLDGSRDAYFIMTCGTDIGNAPALNQALCEEIGLHCRGTQAVVMPENYVAMFPVPNAAAAQKIVQAARPVVLQACRQIAAGLDFPSSAPSLLDRMKSGPINKAFYKVVVKSKKFTVSDACIGCGKCASHCVMGTIRMQDNRPIWEANCTHCMACICGCPTAAIEYGRASRGKPRYQCPQV